MAEEAARSKHYDEENAIGMLLFDIKNAFPSVSWEREHSELGFVFTPANAIPHPHAGGRQRSVPTATRTSRRVPE